MTEQRADGQDSRWQRRERRRQAARSRLQKHGAGLQRVYADAIRKRLAAKKREKRES